MTEQERKRREQRTKFLASENVSSSSSGLSEDERQRREQRTKYLTNDTDTGKIYNSSSQRRRGNVDSRSAEAQRIQENYYKKGVTTPEAQEYVTHLRYNKLGKNEYDLLDNIVNTQEEKDAVTTNYLVQALRGIDSYDAQYKAPDIVNTSKSDEARKKFKEMGYSDDEITKLVRYHQSQRNAENAKIVSEDIKKMAKEHPVLASGVSVVSNIGTPAGLVEVARAKATDTPIDPNSQWFGTSRMTSDIRGEVQENYDWNIDLNKNGKSWDAFDFAYGAGMSAVDSMVASKIMPGLGITTKSGNFVVKALTKTANSMLGGSLIGAQAMTSTMQDVAKRGGTTDQAIGAGVVSFLAETLSEAWSIGNYKGLKESGKQGLRNLAIDLLKSAGVNASEEAITEAVNLVYDRYALGEASNFELNTQAYMQTQKEDGTYYTREEAEKLAWQDSLKQVGEAALSGAFQAVIMGGDAVTSRAVQHSYNEALGKKIKESGNAAEVIKEARQSGDKDVREWVERINKTDTTTSEVNVKDSDLGGVAYEMSKKRENTEEELMRYLAQKPSGTLSASEKVAITNPTLGRKDGKVISLSSVEAVKNGNITVKNSNGETQKLDIKKLDGKAKAIWSYASQHFTDAKAIEGFVKGYNGGNIDIYSRVYKGVFDLASTGMTGEKIKEERMFNLNAISEQAFNYAVEAGNVAMSYKEGVVDLTTAKKSRSQKFTMKMADEFGKRHGMNITFVDTLGTKEGFLTPGKNQIVIALDSSKGAIVRTLGHETFHYVKINAEAQAEQISDFVVETMTRLKGAEWVENQYKMYEEQGYKTPEAQKDELVADQMFEVFANERAVNEFVAKDRNFAQKVLDHIKGIIKEIKSIYNQLISTGKYEDMAAWKEDLEALQKVNDMMLDALSNIEQRRKSEQKAEKNTSDEVMNSKKRNEFNITIEDVKTLQGVPRKSINEFSSEELKIAEKWARKFYKELGVKSPFFRAWFGDWRVKDNSPIKVANIPEYIATNEARKALRGKVVCSDTQIEIEEQNGKTEGWEINISREGETNTISHSGDEGLSEKALSGIRELVENAVLLDTEIHEHHSNNAQNDTICFDHKLYALGKDLSGNIALYKITVEEYFQSKSEPTNKRFHNLRYIKKIADNIGGRTFGNNRSGGSTNDTSTINFIVSDLFGFVKKYDAEFQPKPASKIVNADGTPKVMYHGTQNDFTVFDKKKAKSSGYYGKGFYFTDSESHSSHYGNAMAVYLDVKNPLEQGKNHITKKQLRNFLEAVAENEDDYDIWNYGTEDVDEIINNIYKDDAFAVIQDVNATAIGDLAEAIDLFNKVNKTNYDGVITPTETVVYKPTQIKSATDNIGTFDKDNPDILFSTKRSVEETKDLIAVHNMQESELLKTLQLGGFPMPSIAIIKAQQGHSEYGPVSVVFNKSTIDPKASKNNKVYGGDAWTPTYPTIEYKVNEKVQDKISKLHYELYSKYGADEARPLYNYAYDMEKQLDSNRGEAGMIESLKDDERLMQLYLLQSGKGKVEPVIKQTVTELSDADVEMYDYLISAIGKDVISELKTPPGKKPLQYRTEFYEKNGEKIENAYKQMLRDNFEFTEEEIDNVMDNMRKGDFINLIRRTYQYMVNGKTTTKEETDSKATSEAIRNAIKDSGFNQWVDDLFKGVEEKTGIRNNVDYFTASGNRRSWEALHWENTLENVVKVMKSQNNGVAAFFSGHAIWAVSAKDYKSIDELKADSDRLKSLPKEEYNAIKEGFGMRFNEIATSIMDKSESNQFIAADNAMQCIVEAVRNSKTKSGILNELRQYRQLDVTETAVDDIVSLVSDISNMPTEYFEAKPQRAVELDEIAYVVVPDTSTELVNTLNERGIKTRTYTAGDEADRVRALNSDESILFSTKREYSVSEEASDSILNTKEYQEIIDIVNQRYNLTNKKTLSQKAIDRLAGSLLTKAKSKYDKGALTERLSALFDYMANSEELSWEDVMKSAAEISHDILSNSSSLDKSMQMQYKDTLDYLKSLTIYISPELRAEIDSRYGSLENYRRMLGGKTKITVTDSSKVSLDSLWRELNELAPEMFDAETNSLDQAEELMNFFEITKPQYVNQYEYYWDMNEASYDFALQIYNEYFNIPEIQSESRKHQLEMERLKGKQNAQIAEIRRGYKERMNKIRVDRDKKIEALKKENREAYEKLRNEKNAKIEETKELYRQRNQKYRDDRKEIDERRKLRRQIVRTTKNLTDMLVNPTDKKHIPQELIIGINSFAKTMSEHGAFPLQKAISLQKAFKNIGEKAVDPDFNLASMYDEDVEEMLDRLTETLANKELGKMKSNELKEIKDIADYFSHIVSMSNQAFSDNIRENLSELQTSTLNEVSSQDRDKKRMFTKLQTGLLKPVTFFEILESKTLEKLYTNIRKGEEKWARIVYKVKQKRISLQKKYGYKEWADDRIEVTTERGDKLSITVKEALSIYATSMREQGVDHIMKGGIVLEEKARKELNNKNLFKKNKDKTVNVKDMNIPLSLADIQYINSKLTAQQKDYADEFVRYMSNDMAKLGNEVSMRLYGILKYTEKNYFPLKSASNFLYTEPAVENDTRIKHMSMTKRTVPKANNPVVIGDFTETVMSHCQDMALYYGFTLPLEDFKRVWNYKTPVFESERPTSIKQQLDMVYGKKANEYIKQMLTDINGGVTKQAGAEFVNKMIGLIKKNSVFASLSVAVQQPSALGRAMAYVSPKYFVGKQPKGTWEEIQKYAPVAIVKEMGYFDTGMGRQAVEWMNETRYEGLKEKAFALFRDGNYRDDVLSMLPSFMDEITWGRIWVAVKNETKAKNPELDVDSQEFLEACGERFTYVIDRTQVYDSVFSRSEWMRSKDTGVKVATAFMSEPLTNYNLLYNATIQAKNGNKEFALKAFGAYAVSVIFNSILKSFVSAFRDDDEEKSYWEKYLANLVSGITDDPFGMIPYVKDVIGMLQGYDSNRMDTQVMAEAVDALSTLLNSNKTPYEKIKTMSGVIGAVTGIPVKNIWRELEAFYKIGKKIYEGDFEETTSKGIQYAIKGQYDSSKFKLHDEPALAEQVIEAYINNDTAHYNKQKKNMLEKYGGDVKQVKSQIKSALKEQYQEGKVSKEDARKVMKGTLALSNDEIYWDLDEWDTHLNEGEKYTKYHYWDDAVSSGYNLESAAQKYLNNGVKKEQLLSRITDKYKDEYVSLHNIDPDRAEELMEKLLDAYVAIGYKRSDKKKDIKAWLKQK